MKLHISCNNPLEVLKNKIFILGVFLGDGRKALVVCIKEKRRLLNLIDILDQNSELRPLSVLERANLRDANDNFLNLR
jgi:hypothetical protein